MYLCGKFHLNKRIMEDFKGITQETADDVLRVLKEFNESAESFRSAFDARMEVYMDRCQQASAMKFVEYMHRYVNGTFLTRWYWLRKARKCNDALKGVIQLNEEYFKH